MSDVLIGYVIKIALLTEHYLPQVGGAEVFTYNIAKYLRQAGHLVDVYLPVEKYEALDENYRNLLIPLPRKFFGAVNRIPILGAIRARRYLLKTQRQESYDGWLVVATYPAGYVGRYLKEFVPTVLRASGQDIQKSSELNYGLRLNSSVEAKIRQTVRAYSKVVAMTESSRSEFQELGANDDAIIAIPNGVDLERFALRGDIEQIREELGWPNNTNVILTTGRNHPKKGFNLIPLVAERLRAQGFKFRWYVVGRRVHELNKEVRSRSLGKFVITCDEIGPDFEVTENWGFPANKLVAMYQAADIYAFPTLLENYPMVLPEAMAAGTAIVTTDAPGARDVIKHGVNGLQARSGDIDDFTRQLGSVLGDSRLRNSLSRGAREFAQGLSWHNVAKKYEQVFRELMDVHEDNSQ